MTVLDLDELDDAILREFGGPQAPPHGAFSSAETRRRREELEIANWFQREHGLDGPEAMDAARLWQPLLRPLLMRFWTQWEAWVQLMNDEIGER